MAEDAIEKLFEQNNVLENMMNTENTENNMIREAGEALESFTNEAVDFLKNALMKNTDIEHINKNVEDNMNMLNNLNENFEVTLNKNDIKELLVSLRTELETEATELINELFVKGKELIESIVESTNVVERTLVIQAIKET